VEKVRSELPDGFSAAVADKVLGGVLAAAHALEAMPPN
jgi:serine/threonine-protein kinase HipA